VSSRGLSLFFAIGFVGAAAPYAAAQPEQAIAASIAMVRAQRTGAESQTRASGFVWPDKNHVVTSYHVVAGATNVSVSYDDGANLRAARVVRALPSRDLALLRIDQVPAGVAPAIVSKTRPKARDSITVIGFPQGVAKRLSTTGLVRTQGGGQGAETLGDLLSSGKLRRELQELGFPSFTEKILLLECHLQPGLSGAPIVDADGAVVGIANGGLEKGFSEITWAIPGDALAQLMTASSERVPVDRARLETLFGAELDASRDSTAVAMGDLRAVKLRTRSLAQLTTLNDDPLSIMQVAQALRLANGAVEPSTWEFDIYRIDLASGASLAAHPVIALPKGLQLRAGAQRDEIIAVTNNNSVRWKTKVQQVPPHEVNPRTAEFDQAAAAQVSQVNWTVHPAWSYPIPRYWPNGLTVRRLTMVGFPPGTWVTPMSVPIATATSLHGYYRGVLVSTVTLSLDHATLLGGVANMFATPPAAVQRYEYWAKLALAAFTTGFNDPNAMEGAVQERPAGVW
jgi:S1-C subfamily serine protease